VSRPIVFGVLTTLTAFTALVFLPGNFGQIFANLPLAVIACIVFSVFAALFILPAHLGRFRPDALRHSEGRWGRAQESVSAALEGVIERGYRPLLDRALRARYAVVAGAVMLLLWGMAWVGGGWIRFTFFPSVEAEVISALVTMPLGTPVDRTADAIAQIEAAADGVRRSLEGGDARPGERIYLHVLSSVGQQPYLQRQFSQGGTVGARGGVSGAHLGEVSIELTPSEERSVRATEIRDLWRAEAGPVADAVELVFVADRFSAGKDIDVQLAGPDVDELREISDWLQAELATHPGVSDIADSFRGGKQEIRLAILPSAEALGLTLEDLARQVRQAFYGEEVQRVQRGRDDVRVMVRYPERERRALGDLDNLRVRTPDGAEVPFSVVAQARRERGYAAIQRADRVRVVHVTAAVDETQANANEILADLRRGALAELSALHPRVNYSLEGAQREQSDMLFGILRSFALALVSIYALLAVPLRSYVQPLIVMSAIPFGLLGAVAGHMLLGFELSLLSLFGMIALSGVVVNSSLVYLDFINGRRAAGADLATAIRDAARARFRPVVLTSLTTFAGLAPLLLERSAQAQFIIPMAISLAFGVLFATAITLILVPCMMAIVTEDLAAPR
jgi:multidrug efflux pump subunit AcrB